MLRLVVLAVVAGCGHKPAPKPAPSPVPLDPVAIAATMHADLVKLRDIAGANKEKCPELLAALRSHVAAMRAHQDDVERARADPELAVKLRVEIDAYAEKSRGLADPIGTDLGASWKACTAQREELRKLIDQIPVN